MAGKRLAVQSSVAVSLDAMMQDGVRGTPDVSALASVGTRQVSVLVWHYHDDDVPGPEAAIDLRVSGLRTATVELRVSEYRIDDSHSNAYSAWKRMGSPADPSRAQYRQLEQAGRLSQMGFPVGLKPHDGQVTLAVNLPRQAVSLLVIDW